MTPAGRAGRPHRPHRPPATVALLALLILGYGYIILAEPGRSGRAVQLIAAPSGSPADTSHAEPPATVDPPAAPASPPVRLSIAAIGLDTALESLARRPDGSLQPPVRPDEAGWYAGGVPPGRAGPAVIGGQLDSAAGPAVFFRLRDLRVGDVVRIRRQDGSVLTFEVDGIHDYPTPRLPAAAVYGPTADPELRLITCAGGPGSVPASGYLRNLVISAHLT